jgi:hypothetical protein
MDLTDCAKWFVIILSESLLHYIYVNTQNDKYFEIHVITIPWTHAPLF